MGNEKAPRIQTSILSAVEKRALVWLAKRQPHWITSDMLTWIGVAGAALCGAGFALATIDIRYLWLSSLGLVINWYGDSHESGVRRGPNTGSSSTTPSMR